MITFDALRKANIARLSEFKNSQGEIQHSKSDGSDWTLLEWAGALAGEVGELANLLKKVRRGDFNLECMATRCDVAKEIADVQIYLDILAWRAGIDLGHATISKFNETSRKIGSTIRLRDDGRVVRMWDDPETGEAQETTP